MDTKRVKELIDLVVDSEISELTVGDAGGEVNIVRRLAGESAMPVVPGVGEHRPAAMGGSAETVQPGSILAPARSEAHRVKAPMAGTFHRSAKSEAAPLVEIGAMVEVGTPLCVIEAMKIMNEIESDRAGRIVKILCEEGQGVELDQPLFIIE
jgi:acetyl-CoA carboxylase biotin carboxyl carrier protein